MKLRNIKTYIKTGRHEIVRKESKEIRNARIDVDVDEAFYKDCCAETNKLKKAYDKNYDLFALIFSKNNGNQSSDSIIAGEKSKNSYYEYLQAVKDQEKAYQSYKESEKKFYDMLDDL